MSPVWIIVGLNFLFGYSLAKLPKLKCSLSSKELAACVEEQIGPFVHSIIKDGVPERAVKPFDPLEFPTVVTGLGKGSLRLNFEITKGVFKGLSSSVFKSIKLSKFLPPNNIEFVVMTHHPELVIQGQYKEKMFRARDEGNFTLTISNVDVVSTVKSRYEKRENSTFLRVVRVKLNLTVRGMKIDFFSKNKPNFAKKTIPFINQMWPVLYKETMQHLQPDIERIVADKINVFTLNIPLQAFMSA